MSGLYEIVPTFQNGDTGALINGAVRFRRFEGPGNHTPVEYNAFDNPRVELSDGEIQRHFGDGQLRLIERYPVPEPRHPDRKWPYLEAIKAEQGGHTVKVLNDGPRITAEDLLQLSTADAAEILNDPEMPRADIVDALGGYLRAVTVEQAKSLLDGIEDVDLLVTARKAERAGKNREGVIGHIRTLTG